MKYHLIKLINVKQLVYHLVHQRDILLVEKFINNLKKKYNIKIENTEVIKEDVTFKIPGKLN